jgi:hypothetical protein
MRAEFHYLLICLRFGIIRSFILKCGRCRMQRDVSEQLCVIGFTTFYTAYYRAHHGTKSSGDLYIIFWSIQYDNKVPHNSEVRDHPTCTRGHLMCTRHWNKVSSSHMYKVLK